MSHAAKLTTIATSIAIAIVLFMSSPLSQWPVPQSLGPIDYSTRWSGGTAT
jgi:hypothetical protein